MPLAQDILAGAVGLALSSLPRAEPFLSRWLMMTSERKRLARLEETVFKEPPKMPEVFLQTDPRWREIPLGDSPYFLGVPGVGQGCAVCSVNNLIAQAGFDTDPGRMTNFLNANGGFTSRGYIPDQADGGSGLLYWRVPAQEFPAFHFGVKQPGALTGEIWRGTAGKGSHFNLRLDDGRIFDSIGGAVSWAPVKNWAKAYDVSCDYHVAPSPQPSMTAIPAPTDQYASLNVFMDTVYVRTGGYNLNVRTGAGTEFSIETCVPDRTPLTVIGAIRGSDQNVWYRSVKGNYFSSDFTSKPLK